MKRVDDPIPTRSSLLRKVKNWNDQDQWQRFVDTYGPPIYKTVLEGGLTHTEAEDARQETLRSAMKGLRTFEYDRKKGSFKSWLLQLARWRMIDLIRKRDPILARATASTHSSGRTATIERQPDPAGSAIEPIWDRRWQTDLLEAAARNLKEKIDPKHYQIFDLLVFKQWPVAKVAKFLDVNPGRVYLTKHRVTKQLKKEIANLSEGNF